MQSSENINAMHNNQSKKRITAIPTLHKTTAFHHRPHGGSPTAQACAACKYQRRKCAPDCILAPYFPHDRQPQFLNAHRLFGVSNIIKIVRHLDAGAKDHAMRTIIFQSDARAADPVGGCYRIIRDLEQQISAAKAELDIVHHHLALCRAAAACSAEQEMVAADGGRYAGEKDRDDAAGAGAIDDVNSWSDCMHGNGDYNIDHGNVNAHASAESTSSSFPNFQNHEDDGHNDMRSLSVDDHECNHHDMKTIIDQLSGNDDESSHHDFKFASHGNIISSNNDSSLTEENAAIFKEEDEPFLYFGDRHDSKASANFFAFTNCHL